MDRSACGPFPGNITQINMTQEDIFRRGEADAWFKRNKEALAAKINDPIIRLLEEYKIEPKKILEVGCSNGWRLGLMKGERVGVEPSAEAITDGRKRYPDVRFLQGTASDIPLDETFDLVIVNFVFHWIAREMLLRSVSEVDRCVAKEGGYLVIGDFLPDQPITNEYKHTKGVFTYKMDYASIFTAANLYKIIALETFSHGGGENESDNRGHRTILKRVK